MWKKSSRPNRKKNQNKDLAKVTDYEEDAEVDTRNAQNLQRNVQKFATFEEDKKKAQRERELAAVSIKEEDITLIASELELPRHAAERTLREHKGDVVAALRFLVSTN